MHAPQAELQSRCNADAMALQFRCDVLAGLSQRQKSVPSRWFYDHRGSELFEQITALPEYYPTRTEIGIFEACMPDIAAQIRPSRAVVEFGAGSMAKTPLLLDAIAPSAYVPVDISGEFLRESCAALASRFPNLPVVPVEADFMQPFVLPDVARGAQALGFFPGSTIGNMEPASAAAFLRAMGETLGDDAMLLIGFDLIKQEQRLIEAYDDSAGITGAFNLNMAARINRELGGTIPLDALVHKAIWNAPLARIEMHLVATSAMAFEVCGQTFAMAEGETIHTENSHKYSRQTADLLLRAGGWQPLAHWCDHEQLFLVVLARAT